MRDLINYSIFIIFLAVSPNLFAQSIYDSATGVNPTTRSDYAYKVGTGNNGPIENYPLRIGDLCPIAVDTVTSGNTDTFVRHNTSCELKFNNIGFAFRADVTFDQYQVNDLGDQFNQQFGLLSQTAFGNTPITVTECGKDGNGAPTSYTFEYNGLCYDPLDLQLFADCPVDSLIATNSSGSSTICNERSDGSRCLMTKAQNNSGDFFYVQSLEPATCFDGTEPYDEQLPNPPTGQDCQDIGNGITACPENPSNVCDENGVCPTGCGYMAFNGAEQFVCLSEDTDGDGIGDYIDPDVDGDGIPNDQDPDYEPPQGDDNGSGGGSAGGTGNVNVDVQVDVDLSELVEQVDIDSNAEQSIIDGFISDLDQQTDAFIQDNQDTLTDAVNQSDVANSLDTLKNSIQSQECNLSVSFSVSSNNESADLCEYAPVVKPFLAILFAMSTFVYVVVRVSSTVTGAT